MKYTLSRRAFLRRSGLLGTALGAARLPHFDLLIADPDAMPTLARAFGLTAVYRQPTFSSAVEGHLAPDSVHAISAAGRWYRMEHGFIPREAMQPIRAYTPPLIESHSAAPFWATLIAPISAARAWCGVQAPITVTWGYGAVTSVLGTLTDDYGLVWYESAVGWFDARHWQRLHWSSSVDSASLSVAVDPLRRHLIVSGTDGHWRTPYYGGNAIRQPIRADVQTEKPGDPSGIGWWLRLSSGDKLHGAWDHNRFGMSGGGESVEIAPAAAERLYRQSLAAGNVPDR